MENHGNEIIELKHARLARSDDNFMNFVASAIPWFINEDVWRKFYDSSACDSNELFLNSVWRMA